VNQATLFDVPSKPAPRRRKSAAQRRAEREAAFARFHRQHPEVYERLLLMALSLKAKGVTRYGIRALWEALRYEAAIHTNEQPYKLSDHYPPFYSRLLMQREARLAGFFETRSR